MGAPAARVQGHPLEAREVLRPSAPSHRIRGAVLALAWLAPLGAPRAQPAGAEEPAGIAIGADDLVITASTRVRPGTYAVVDRDGDGVVHVRGKGVRLDLTGVTLVGAASGADPSTHAGIGISVEGAEGCEIVGGSARGFRVGLRAQGCPGLSVTGFEGSGNRRDRLKSTPEAEDAEDWLWPHENDEGQWEKRYGAAISLVDCEGAKVTGCACHHGQNGLLLSRCDRAVVVANDFSFNSGWGIALWRTSHARFVRNRCDFCVRGYSHGAYARGQDSAGFLVFEQCSHNLFASNSATHSGDGFFLYAGNETLKVTGKGGCNGNRVVRNDFSHAVANGIEATFSDGNIIGMYVFSDLVRIFSGQSMHNVDQNGHLIAAAAIGAGDEALFRAEMLLAARCDVLVIDTAHGDSKNVISTIKELKARHKSVEVVAGNVSCGESVERLIAAGVDGVLIGQGPGSICTTRIVAGIGCPQVSAVYECARAAEGSGVPVCADGGIQHPGDIAIAIAVGAGSVMLGSILAGTDKSPGDIIQSGGRQMKRYRGMGSLGAMLDRAESRARYGQTNVAVDKLVPEGIEGVVPYSGPLHDVLNQYVGGLRAAMGYLGQATIEGFQANAELFRITNAGLAESHPHDIVRS